MGNYILMLGKKEKGCVRGLWPLKCSKLKQNFGFKWINIPIICIQNYHVKTLGLLKEKENLFFNKA